MFIVLHVAGEPVHKDIVAWLDAAQLWLACMAETQVEAAKMGEAMAVSLLEAQTLK